jgi:hypothetical protein
MSEIVQNFKPDVLHGHWVHYMAPLLSLARKHNIPFTFRAHSFDVVTHERSMPLDMLNSSLCRGILCFPWARPLLIKSGIHESKLVDCFPVVSFKMFHDRSPNGTGVMTTGSPRAKRGATELFAIAEKMPEQPLDAYFMDYGMCSQWSKNKHIKLMPLLAHEDMPAEYKRHRWFLGTACRKLGTVGWPVSVAEAQASGCGVLMPNLRPDLRDYVGEAGFLYNSAEEAVEFLKQPFPDAMRERGFELARRSDVSEHIKLLTDLWN